MDKKKTETKILKEEVENIIFPKEEGYIRGNIKKFNCEIITLDCTEEDVNNFLNESIIVRPYFEHSDKKIKVPVFFTCIKGVYDDVGQYLKLLDKCKKAKNNIFITSVEQLLSIHHVKDGLFKNKKIEEVLGEKININIDKMKRTISSIFNINEYKYAKYFNATTNKFNVEEIIKSREKGLSKYSVEMQRYLLEKLNDYLNSYSFVSGIHDIEKLKLLEYITALNDDIIFKINNFEVSKVSPKITLFLSNTTSLSNLDILFIGYLHELGIDIIIFTPSGTSNLEVILSKKVFSTVALDKLNNEVNYNFINQINRVLSKFKVNVNDLDDSLKDVGYNAPIKQYEIQINLFKNPMLKRIGEVIKGWQLTLIGILGIIIDIYLMFLNGGNVLIFSIILMIVFIILFIIFILGIKLLSLDM